MLFYKIWFVLLRNPYLFWNSSKCFPRLLFCAGQKNSYLEKIVSKSIPLHSNLLHPLEDMLQCQMRWSGIQSVSDLVTLWQRFAQGKVRQTADWRLCVIVYWPTCADDSWLWHWLWHLHYIYTLYMTIPNENLLYKANNMYCSYSNVLHKKVPRHRTWNI